MTSMIGRMAVGLGLVACAATFVVGATVGLAAQAAIVAADPWVREPLPKAEQTAVFVVLENKSGEKRQLVSASTTVAEKVELHTMSTTDGMMKMTQVKSIDVPANGRAELKPGGFHIMLFGLKEHPAAGSTVPLTLTLDNGQTMSIVATVRKPEGMK